MVTYRVNSDNIFLGGFTETTVKINECNPELEPLDFKTLYVVGPNEKYDALEVFGCVVRGSALTKLAGVLCMSGVNVNRHGYIYLLVDGYLRTTLGKRYYRLNDVLDWSDFGVKPPMTMTWNRCGLPDGNTIISYEDQKNCLEKLQNDLREREKEINDLKNQLSNSMEHLQSKEKELKDASRKLSMTESVLKSTNNELQLPNAQVVAGQKEFEDCKKQLQAKDGELRTELVELSFAEAVVRSTRIELQKELTRSFSFDRR